MGLKVYSEQYFSSIASILRDRDDEYFSCDLIKSYPDSN